MIWNFGNNLLALQRHALRCTVLVFAVLFVVSHESLLEAAERSPTLQQKLQREVSVTWQGQQLATALERLTGAAQIPLWLDRRVDRQQAVTMQFADLRYEQAFEELAEHQSLGFLRLDRVVYFGPRQTALELPTLVSQAHDQLVKLPSSLRKRWLRARTTSWPRLSEPRKLAESWLAKEGLELVGSEQIAHDLWPAKSLPAMPLVDRLVLLLAGFDLTCQIASDGKSCEIVPISRPLQLSRRQALQKPSRPKHETRRTGKGKSLRLFTLRLENQPLGRVLDQFAQQLQLEVDWTVESKLPRAQLVSCDVQGVELDELLRVVLQSAGLLHQLNGTRVTIRREP